MKHPWSITLILLFLFLITQVFSLALLNFYVDDSVVVQKETVSVGGVIVAQKPVSAPILKDLPNVAGVKIERPNTPPKTNLLMLSLMLLFGTVIFLVVMWISNRILVKILQFFTLFLPLLVVFNTFIPEKYSLTISVLLIAWLTLKPNLWVNNLVQVLVIGGIAVFLVPVLDVFYAFIFLVIISLYDVYAVWVSKHMVKMAEYALKNKFLIGFHIKYDKKKNLDALVGNGDILFPLFCAGAVMLKYGFLAGIIVSVCSAIALFLLMYFSKEGRFYPAMPYLTGGCFAGYIGVLLLFGG